LEPKWWLINPTETSEAVAMSRTVTPSKPFSANSRKAVEISRVRPSPASLTGFFANSILAFLDGPNAAGTRQGSGSSIPNSPFDQTSPAPVQSEFSRHL
jgi:hypothetical protein